MDFLTTVDKDEDGAVYLLFDCAIHWDSNSQYGELYSPDGLFITASDDLGHLAGEAMRHGKGE
jgi:hypothetical protein